MLQPGDDVAEIARGADADALGMAGGDGSLATLASVAVERDLPLVCVPFGTRNHFARDVGLDPDDPIAALDSFASGVERRVDVGRAGDRLFLNNVSRRLRPARPSARTPPASPRGARQASRAPPPGPAARTARDHDRRRAGRGAHPARLEQPLHARSLLARRAAATRRGQPLPLPRRRAPAASLGRPHAGARADDRLAPFRVVAAIDGEPFALEFPLRIATEPRALRVLVPQPE